MESEAIDKRMVREATIGLVVLVALIALLFLTIWLKAKSIWADASEDLMTAPVNVYTLGHGDVLVPTKKPSPVPLPQIESNEIVDLGEMRPISNERMAAMFGASEIDENLRVAAVDPNIGLPVFPTPSTGLATPGPTSPSLPTPGLPSPNSLPLSPQLSNPEPVPALPPSTDLNGSSGPNLPTLPSSPAAGEERRANGLPEIGSTSVPDVILASSDVQDEVAQDKVAQDGLPQSSNVQLPITSGTTPIAFSPTPLPSSSLPSPEPMTSINQGSSVAANPADSVTEENPSSAAPEFSDPLNGALQRAAAAPGSLGLPAFAQPSELEDPRDSTANQSEEPRRSADTSSIVTQIQVQDAAREEDAGIHAPTTYSADELKRAIRRVSLPSGTTMAQLSSGLYGDARYAAALQQLNHRRADDRGRFLPGTQIAYLPGEMLEFVYPDLVSVNPSVAETGPIQPVEYQEQSPEATNITARSESRERAEANVERPTSNQSNASEANNTPDWIVTQGGESLFQLAVDHYDQASYYLYLLEWNRETMEGHYRPTDPLPKGLRIRLTPVAR